MRRPIFSYKAFIPLLLVSVCLAQSPATTQPAAEMTDPLPSATQIDEIAAQLPADDPQLAVSPARRAALGELLTASRDWLTGETGGVIPDFVALVDQPDEYIGKLCLIEGTLTDARRVDRPVTPDWWLVQRWSIETADGVTVWVYLTKPEGVTFQPAEGTGDTDEMPREQLVEVGAAVRLAGKFFGVSETDAARGGTPIFVARSPTLIDVAPIASAVPPLTASQQAQLATASDRSSSVDEAAFYALLDNAADWPDTAVGAIVPDVELMKRNPAAWRGRLCLIEGELRGVRAMPGLNRANYRDTTLWVIRTDDEQHLLVYLADAPKTSAGQQEGIPAEFGSRVRIVARYYKPVSQKPARIPGDDEPVKPILYPAFVGNTATWISQTTGNTGSGGSGAPPVGWVPMVVVVVLMLGGYFVVVRILGSRKSKASEIMEMRRAARGSYEEEEDFDEPDDLPEDPAGALDRLKRKHAEDAEKSPES